MMNYGHCVNYLIELRNLRTGALLLTHEDSDIDLWRSRGEFVRPKCDIDRTLNIQEYLRDEQVGF